MNERKNGKGRRGRRPKECVEKHFDGEGAWGLGGGNRYWHRRDSDEDTLLPLLTQNFEVKEKRKSEGGPKRSWYHSRGRKKIVSVGGEK